MSVNAETLPEDTQVVATLVEQSQGLFHKILLAEDDEGEALFYRETLDLGSYATTFVLGPFTKAADALYGINLL